MPAAARRAACQSSGVAFRPAARSAAPASSEAVLDCGSALETAAENALNAFPPRFSRLALGCGAPVPNALPIAR